MLPTVPHSLPEQPVPLKDQFTSLFDVPATVAVNCCVPFNATVAVAGETVTEIGMSVTSADAVFDGSITEVTFTVDVDCAAITAGAWYKPFVSRSPSPVSDQVTALLA